MINLKKTALDKPPAPKKLPFHRGSLVFKVEVDNCETGRGIILPNPSEQSRIVKTAEVKPQRTDDERKPVPSTVCVFPQTATRGRHCLFSERNHNLAIRNQTSF